MTAVGPAAHADADAPGPDLGGVTGGTGGIDAADAVAAAVLDEPGVARLSGGPAGAVATYLAGRRVPGVRLTDSGVEIHLVAHWVPSLVDLGERVRSAVRPLAGGRTVDVRIDDLAEPEVPVAELEPPAGPVAALPSGEGPMAALPSGDGPPIALPAADPTP